MHTEFSIRLTALAREATRTGEPIIRPVFWLHADNQDALTCDDEFLLGNGFLVAPVVHPDILQRDILLPSGAWKDHWTGEIFQGPARLLEYPATLETLPLFERLSGQANLFHHIAL